MSIDSEKQAQAGRRGRNSKQKENNMGTVKANVTQHNVNIEEYLKQHDLEDLYNTIEVGEWEERGSGMIAQVSFKMVPEGEKKHTRINWVKFWRDDMDSPFSPMKVTWKDDKGNYQRAKVKMVAGSKIEEEEGDYSIQKAIVKLAGKMLMKADMGKYPVTSR